MIEIRETAAVIALVRRGDRLWHHYANLVESAGSALAVLRGEYSEFDSSRTLALFNADPPSAAEDQDLDAIVEEIAAWRDEGLDVLTVLDEAYPSNLRTIHDRPPLLFVRGRLSEADDLSVAVVGTRRPSAAGLRAAGEMARGIAEAGYTVVSGLASGIDTAAHEAALAVASRTVAVIGTGLRRSYPPSSATLQRRLGEESAVVSQFWPDAPPTKASFPMRNAVMSGLALATVVIEATGASGARMHARLALEHNRPVFLLSSLLEHPWAREYAARPGTHVVESADEVLDCVERLTSLDALSV